MKKQAPRPQTIFVPAAVVVRGSTVTVPLNIRVAVAELFRSTVARLPVVEAMRSRSCRTCATAAKVSAR